MPLKEDGEPAVSVCVSSGCITLFVRKCFKWDLVISEKRQKSPKGKRQKISFVRKFSIGNLSFCQHSRGWFGAMLMFCAQVIHLVVLHYCCFALLYLLPCAGFNLG